MFLRIAVLLTFALLLAGAGSAQALSIVLGEAGVAGPSLERLPQQSLLEQGPDSVTQSLAPRLSAVAPRAESEVTLELVRREATAGSVCRDAISVPFDVSVSAGATPLAAVETDTAFALPTAPR